MSPRGGPGVPRPRSPKPVLPRFMAKVRVAQTGCWEWQGYIESNGYGYFRHPETSWAHRVSYMIHVGPIADGLEIDHLCRNKRCVNPDHLEPVTRRVNQRRAKSWTTCHRFHPSEPSRFTLRGDGRRVCLECKRVSEQQRRDARTLLAANISDPHTAYAGDVTHVAAGESAGQQASEGPRMPDDCNHPWVRSPSA